MSEPEYLTVSQAAARLGISERQARRYARKLGHDDRREPDTASGVRVMTVRLSAMLSAYEAATSHQSPILENETAPDTRPAQAGHEAGRDDHAPDMSTPVLAALLAEKDARIDDLRSQVDAWRLQAEAANRTASETAAALRKALDVMPLALPNAGKLEQVGTEKTVPTNTPQTPITATGDQTATNVKQSPNRGAQAKKLTAWQRVAARISGRR